MAGNFLLFSGGNMILSVDFSAEEFFIKIDGDNNFSVDIEFITDGEISFETYTDKPNVIRLKRDRGKYLRSVKVYSSDSKEIFFNYLLFPISQEEYKTVTETVGGGRIRDRKILRFSMCQLVDFFVSNNGDNLNTSISDLEVGQFVNSFTIFIYKSIEMNLEVPYEYVEFFISHEIVTNPDFYERGRVISTRKDLRQANLSLKSSLWHAFIYLGLTNQAIKVLDDVYEYSKLECFDQISFSYNISNAIFILSYINFKKGNFDISSLYINSIYSFFFKISKDLEEKTSDKMLSYGRFADIVKLSKVTQDCLLLLERIRSSSVRSLILDDDYLYENVVRAKSNKMKEQFIAFLNC